MSETIRRESPLVEHVLPTKATSRPGNAPIYLGERAGLAHINLRGDPGDAGFLAAAEGVLGCALALTPNTFHEADGIRVYWLGPDEWLVVASGEEDDLEDKLADALRAAFAGRHTAVTAVGHGQTMLVIGGREARHLLAQGCPLDLHERSFGIGRCAQSHLVKAGVTLAQVSAEPVFELIVRRSFADYVWKWLQHTAGEQHVIVKPAPWPATTRGAAQVALSALSAA